MKVITWIWRHLDGIKTLIGGLLHAAWFLYYVIFDRTIPLEHQLTGHGIIGILTGVGLGHKIVKAKAKRNGNLQEQDGEGN